MDERTDTDGATIHELPVRADGTLTDRQRRILETIRDSVETRGYPPSMREIGEAVGLASSSSVKHQLSALEAKGYLRRDPNRPRAIEVVLPGEVDQPLEPTHSPGAPDTNEHLSMVPLVG